ncbi:permease [Nonlabens tegetincola]|uniref:Permease n=2 Tax=Nonlabens tegetincola TaxID=323273 RepID=A0A090QN00_9FLAO|nr:permease [Nonlabens tegetincola]
MFLRDRLKFGNTFAVLLTLVFLLILILSAVSLLIPLAIEQSDNLKLLDNDEVSRNLEIFANQVSEFFGIQRVNIYELVKETEYYQNLILDFSQT